MLSHCLSIGSAGNMGYDHTESEAGISWYTHMWQMFPEGVPASCKPTSPLGF